MCSCVCAARETEVSQTRTDALKDLASAMVFELCRETSLLLPLVVPLWLFFILSFFLHQRADRSSLSTRTQNNYPPTFAAMLPSISSLPSSPCLLPTPPLARFLNSYSVLSLPSIFASDPKLLKPFFFCSDLMFFDLFFPCNLSSHYSSSHIVSAKPLLCTSSSVLIPAFPHAPVSLCLSTVIMYF